MPYGFGASAPVTTATTPSSACAREVSICLIRACGYGEWRILPTNIPGSLKSSVYLPAPVVLPAASTMAIDFPITENSLITASLLPAPDCCPRVRLQSPRELPGTSASTRCSDTNYCSTLRESLLRWDRDYWPAAIELSS